MFRLYIRGVLIQVVIKYREYLLRCTFKIMTGFQAFQKTMDKKDLMILMTWVARLLEEHSFEIEHGKATWISHVDALGRHCATPIEN